MSAPTSGPTNNSAKSSAKSDILQRIAANFTRKEVQDLLARAHENAASTGRAMQDVLHDTLHDISEQLKSDKKKKSGQGSPSGNRATMIAQALKTFRDHYGTADNLAQDIGTPSNRGAFNELSKCLQPVGIEYQNRDQSVQNNPGIHGHHIGEVLDMLYTLYKSAEDPKSPDRLDFKAQKFWHKLTTMYDIFKNYKDFSL